MRTEITPQSTLSCPEVLLSTVFCLPRLCFRRFSPERSVIYRHVGLLSKGCCDPSRASSPAASGLLSGIANTELLEQWPNASRGGFLRVVHPVRAPHALTIALSRTTRQAQWDARCAPSQPYGHAPCRYHGPSWDRAVRELTILMRAMLLSLMPRACDPAYAQNVP